MRNPIRELTNLIHFARSFPREWLELRNELATLRAQSTSLAMQLERQQEDRLEQRLLARLAQSPRSIRSGEYVNRPGYFYELESKLSELAALHPAAYPAWLQAFEEAQKAYANDPTGSLSLEGHHPAEIFRAFIAPYMSGSVLDIGCGPQELPVYLRGFKVERVAGLDPLSGYGQRRFEFRQGFAEFLPWDDAQFDVVIFATSLDHVLSLERTLDEVCRVLRPGGVCIVWAGLVPGSRRYEPDRAPVVAIDRFHLFHFSDETLRETFASRFELFEQTTYRKENGFYIFVRREDL